MRQRQIANPPGPKGTDGIVPMYDSLGLITSPRSWIGTATVGANGVWTVDYSSAGFSAPPLVNAVAIGGTTVASGVRCSLSAAPTKTGAAGIATMANTITILGAFPSKFADAGTVLQVQVFGRGPA